MGHLRVIQISGSGSAPSCYGPANISLAGRWLEEGAATIRELTLRYLPIPRASGQTGVEWEAARSENSEHGIHVHACKEWRGMANHVQAERSCPITSTLPWRRPITCTPPGPITASPLETPNHNHTSTQGDPITSTPLPFSPPNHGEAQSHPHHPRDTQSHPCLHTCPSPHPITFSLHPGDTQSHPRCLPQPITATLPPGMLSHIPSALCGKATSLIQSHRPLRWNPGLTTASIFRSGVGMNRLLAKRAKGFVEGGRDEGGGEKSAISTREGSSQIGHHQHPRACCSSSQYLSGRAGPKAAQSQGLSPGLSVHPGSQPPPTLKYPWACPVRYQSAGEPRSKEGRGCPQSTGEAPHPIPGVPSLQQDFWLRKRPQELPALASPS